MLFEPVLKTKSLFDGSLNMKIHTCLICIVNTKCSVFYCDVRRLFVQQ